MQDAELHQRNWTPPETHQLWRSSVLPEKERFRYYREAVCEVFMELSPEMGGFDDLDVTIETMPTGEGVVNRVKTTPHHVHRTRQQISKASSACYYVNLQISGRSAISQGNNQILLHPGQVGIFTDAQPFKIDLIPGQPVELASFWVSQEKLNRVTSSEQFFNGAVITDRPGIGSLLSSTMQALAGRFSRYSTRERTALYENFLNLIPLAAGASDEMESPETTTAIQNTLLNRILDFVDRRLGDPALDVQEVALQFGVSRRYVHKLFEPSGESFSNYVLSQRLERIAGDLSSPLGRHKLISTIAYDNGFGDLSYFNKRFKAEYGVTPGEFRQASAIKNGQRH